MKKKMSATDKCIAKKRKVFDDIDHLKNVRRECEREARILRKLIRNGKPVRVSDVYMSWAQPEHASISSAWNGMVTLNPKACRAFHAEILKTYKEAIADLSGKISKLVKTVC